MSQVKEIFQEQAPHSGKTNGNGKTNFNSHLLSFIRVSDHNGKSLGHSQCVANYALLLTTALGIEDKIFLAAIEKGALLHDIGKIGVPQSILRKVGPLTAQEKEIIKDHPRLGYEMIEGLEFLKRAAQVVLFHHEHYNGNGYPYGLAGKEIPLEARVFAVADALDACTSDRPYRKGKNFGEALIEITKHSGSQFDPLIVDTLLSIPADKWLETKFGMQALPHLSNIG